MSKRTAIDRAIDGLKAKRAVLDDAIAALEEQKKQAPKRTPRATAVHELPAGRS